MTEKHMKHDPEEDVELGVEVKTRRERPSGPVVAVRVPREVLAKLSEYAQLRHTTVSDVVRQAAIRLASELDAGPFYTSGVRLEGPRLVSGNPTRGGQIRTLEYEPGVRMTVSSDDDLKPRQ